MVQVNLYQLILLTIRKETHLRCSLTKKFKISINFVMKYICGIKTHFQCFWIISFVWKTKWRESKKNRIFLNQNNFLSVEHLSKILNRNQCVVVLFRVACGWVLKVLCPNTETWHQHVMLNTGNKIWLGSIRHFCTGRNCEKKQTWIH